MSTGTVRGLSEEEIQEIREIVENREALERFLSHLIYFAHVDDIEKTEADWLGLGSEWRDKDKGKTFEACRIHIGRCKTCRERLKHCMRHLDIGPSQG